MYLFLLLADFLIFIFIFKRVLYFYDFESRLTLLLNIIQICRFFLKYAHFFLEFFVFLTFLQIFDNHICVIGWSFRFSLNNILFLTVVPYFHSFWNNNLNIINSCLCLYYVFTWSLFNLFWFLLFKVGDLCAYLFDQFLLFRRFILLFRFRSLFF